MVSLEQRICGTMPMAERKLVWLTADVLPVNGDAARIHVEGNGATA
jgi:hypothetical protein